MHLPEVFMQLSGWQAGMPEIIQNDLSAGCCSDDIVSPTTLGPGNIDDVYRIDLAGLARRLSWGTPDGTAEIEIFCASAILDSDGFEDFLTAEQRMRTLLVDRESVNLQSGAVARCGVLRSAQGGISSLPSARVSLIFWTILGTCRARIVSEESVRCVSSSL